MKCVKCSMVQGGDNKTIENVVIHMFYMCIIYFKL